MIFNALPDKTRWEGILVCAWLVVADLLLLLWAFRRPIDWIKFAFLFAVALSIPLFLYWAYRTWAAFTIEYWVERNAVTVRWANEIQEIPLQSIQQIIQGGVADLGASSRIYWPAPYIRPGRGLGLVNLMLAATVPLVDCLVLQMDDRCVALSPADDDAFIRTIQRRFGASGATVGSTLPTVQQPEPALQRIFGLNRAGLVLLIGGLLGALVLVGVLMVNFPSLPDALTLQTTSDGVPTLIRNKSSLFVLPMVGFMAWVVNGIGGLFMTARRQPTGAYMLWGGTIVVQICSLLALMSVLP